MTVARRHAGSREPWSIYNMVPDVRIARMAEGDEDIRAAWLHHRTLCSP
jgi:hypothetical protein